MTTQTDNIERISRIAHSPIPVSEESSIYNFFAQRREVANRILSDDVTESAIQLLLDNLNYLETGIKKYLGL